ncbi:MAG: metallopeptidase family protein [Acidobacteria bacterium]|nr:metallopeptidase family protein [Acidobacteriota bacterium]
MTDERFEQLVAEAMDRIPRFFREEIPQFFHEDIWNDNVAVLIQEEPSPELLADLGIEPPDTLYGLYEGTPRTEREWSPMTALPDRITIVRKPILEDAEDEDDVFRAIGETIIHEYGHYFGLSEEEIDEAEAIWAEELETGEID